MVKKDPGRARQNSLATAGTNFTKPGAHNKGALCIIVTSPLSHQKVSLFLLPLSLHITLRLYQQQYWSGSYLFRNINMRSCLLLPHFSCMLSLPLFGCDTYQKGMDRVVPKADINKGGCMYLVLYEDQSSMRTVRRGFKILNCCGYHIYMLPNMSLSCLGGV